MASQTICDICNKTIEENTYNWYKVLPQKQTWIGHGVEPKTLFDICSKECLVKYVSRFNV